MNGLITVMVMWMIMWNAGAAFGAYLAIWQNNRRRSDDY